MISLSFPIGLNSHVLLNMTSCQELLKFGQYPKIYAALSKGSVVSG